MSSDCRNGGSWSCSGSGYDWSNLSCVCIRHFLGYRRWPSMVDFVLDKYLCIRSNDGPGQEAKKFLWLLSPIHIEWGSSMMHGDNTPVWYLTCTSTHSPQNIFQELWTLSLVYFAGSNLACTGLSVVFLYLSLWIFHSICRNAFEGCGRAFQKRSENLVFFGRHVDVVFFRATARTFLISNKY